RVSLRSSDFYYLLGRLVDLFEVLKRILSGTNLYKRGALPIILNGCCDVRTHSCSWCCTDTLCTQTIGHYFLCNVLVVHRAISLCQDLLNRSPPGHIPWHSISPLHKCLTSLRISGGALT